MQENCPIRILDEWARRTKNFLEFRSEKKSNPVDGTIFTVRLQIGEKFYFSTGPTLKSTKLNAARSALNEIRPTAIEILNDWASSNRQHFQFVLIEKKSTNSHQIYFYRLYFSVNLFFDGQGFSHQQARNRCALNALYFLRYNSMSPPSTPPSASPSTSNSQSNTNHLNSSVSLMYERAKRLGLTVLVEWVDPLTVIYRVGDKISAKGKASTRNLAKQIAAEEILRILSSKTKSIENKSNPLTRLYKLAQDRNVSINFVQLDPHPHHDYRFQVFFDENHSAEGSGPTKQIAKQTAAEVLLEKLEPIVVAPMATLKSSLKRDGSSKKEKKHVQFVEEVIVKDEELSKRSSTVVSSPTVSNVQQQQLIEFCDRLKINVQFENQFNRNEENGSSRHQSIVSLSDQNKVFAQFRGQGPSAMRAQENASSAASTHLKQVFATTNELF